MIMISHATMSDGSDDTISNASVKDIIKENDWPYKGW